MGHVLPITSFIIFRVFLMLFYCKSISCEFQSRLDLRFLVSNTFLYVLHLVVFWNFLENFLTHTDIQRYDLFCNFSLIFTFGKH